MKNRFEDHNRQKTTFELHENLFKRFLMDELKKHLLL